MAGPVRCTLRGQQSFGKLAVLRYMSAARRRREKRVRVLTEAKNMVRNTDARPGAASTRKRRRTRSNAFRTTTEKEPSSTVPLAPDSTLGRGRSPFPNPSATTEDPRVAVWQGHEGVDIRRFNPQDFEHPPLQPNHLLEENDFYDDMLMRIEFADDASDPCNGERIDPFGTFAPTFAFR